MGSLPVQPQAPLIGGPLATRVGAGGLGVLALQVCCQDEGARAREEEEEYHEAAQIAPAAAGTADGAKLLELEGRAVCPCGAQQTRLAAKVEPTGVIHLRGSHRQRDLELGDALHGHRDSPAELLLREVQGVLRVVHARALRRRGESQAAVLQCGHVDLGLVRYVGPAELAQGDALAGLPPRALVHVEEREVEVVEGDGLVGPGIKLLDVEGHVAACLDVDAPVPPLEADLLGRLRVEVRLGAGDVDTELELLAIVRPTPNAHGVDQALLYASVRALPAEVPERRVDEAEERIVATVHPAPPPGSRHAADRGRLLRERYHSIFRAGRESRH
mmetsp:Transcript_80970/g.182706  ORF Transcript_80970/g.182706 Transcript_80970/m.182706 type:complete len:331 (+) Transcript_80970:92-1084(+)